MKKKLSREEIQVKLANDPDFINSPKHSYSLESLTDANPNGVNDRFAASLLAMSLEDFQALFQAAIKKYRRFFKIDVD